MKHWRLAIAMSALSCITLTAHAQYPNRPIRLIVPQAAGSASDTSARILAHEFTRLLGQQVVVDNRAGASGIIGAEMGARAAPDGYSLIMATISSMATNVSLTRNLPYDPVKSFTPVGLAGTDILVITRTWNFAQGDRVYAD